MARSVLLTLRHFARLLIGTTLCNPIARYRKERMCYTIFNKSFIHEHGGVHAERTKDNLSLRVVPYKLVRDSLKLFRELYVN